MGWYASDYRAQAARARELLTQTLAAARAVGMPSASR